MNHAINALFYRSTTHSQYAGYFIALVGLNLHKEYKKNPDKVSQSLTSYATCGASKRLDDKKQDSEVDDKP